MTQLSKVKSKLPKGTDVYAAYVAGIVSAALLAFFFWRSTVQFPPSGDGE